MHEEKKRIALIVNTLSSGGAEHVAANLSRALSDRYDVDLILNDDKNISYPYEGDIISLGMPADGERMSAKYQATALLKRTALLRRLKAKRKYAATISFSDNTNLSNALSGGRSGKTVISVRNSLEGKENSEKKKALLHRLSLDISAALADTVVSCSGEIGDELKKRPLFNKRKLRIIYNGIDLKAVEQAKTATNTKDKDRPGAKIPKLINIGRLSEQKAQWHLLYALKELKDRGVKAELTILGEGPLRRDLEELCIRLGIKDQVNMPGWVDDTDSYVADSDVAVFSSSYEGFCNAILEAMACGVPCVSTDHHTGAREILAPGTDRNKKVTDNIEQAEYGILVPVSDGSLKDRPSDKPDEAEKLLADAVQILLEDSVLAEKYKKAGKERAQELSLEAAADQWDKVISEKNILFLISSLSGGGAERVTVNLANALCDRYNVGIVTLFSKPDEYHPDERVEMIRYSDYRERFNKPVLKLVLKLQRGYIPRVLWVRRVKKRFKPAATISLLKASNLINALTPCGDFRIVSERSDPSEKDDRYRAIIKQAAGLADHMVFQSKRVQNMFPSAVKRKSSVILNPVDVRTVPTGNQEKRIVTAGRLIDQKNHMMLIRAFGRFHETHREHVLEIYGKGPLKEELEQLAASVGVADHVRIKDFASDLHEQIKDAEMFILSSDFEGLSNALLEAMMMGLPCISTDCAGSDEVIEDKVNGLLVPVGDEEALFEAMKTLADDESLRRKIAENGKISSNRFKTDTVIKQWIDLIEKNT